MVLITNTVKRLALESLAKTNLHHFSVQKNSPSKEYALLHSLYQLNEITEQDISDAMSSAVIGQAKADYKSLQRKGKLSSPYTSRPFQKAAQVDVSNPEILAYAIANGVFSKREQKRIPLTVGWTLDDFVEDYSNTHLIVNLRDDVMNKMRISAKTYFAPQKEELSEPGSHL